MKVTWNYVTPQKRADVWQCVAKTECEEDGGGRSHHPLQQQYSSQEKTAEKNEHTASESEGV